ncbi:hypothetical protein [Croceibacter atlanticus]|uniref:hypothetical protein n=1 Tax=Croceibacter atlanticus TaxID=313588 RepID=UPI0024BB1684|nr:hypothetical protein [Croceibacter atlanticus]WSP33515.1 hypothetical protein VVL01_08805 [Croceibacter atlanticus]
MIKTLIFSSICKPKKILEQTIPSWVENANIQNADILLYDDNVSKESSTFLRTFSNKSSFKVEGNWVNKNDTYNNHAWRVNQVDHIIGIKNKAIQYALKHNYDYLFLVDADLVLNPNTLQHLIGLKKDFVFELFWTVFTDQTFAKPNCWDVHSWQYLNKETILQLKEPGTYPVNAGGACTLLSKKALKIGLDFTRLKNLPYGGEDRHFCTRAEALGIDIFIDTHYPAYHIFSTNMVKEAKQWVKNGCSPNFFKSWLGNSWYNAISQMFIQQQKKVPRNKFEKLKIALYKGKRAFVNYMRYN